MRRATVLVLAAVAVCASAAVVPVATAAPGSGNATNTTMTTTATNTTAGGGSGGGGGGGGLLGGAVGDIGSALEDALMAILRKVGVDQALAAIGTAANAALEGSVYTPHPNSAADWYRAPDNAPWSGGWEEYQTHAMPLWFALTVVSAGLGLAMRAGGMFTPQQFAEWRKRWLVGTFVGRWSWELGSLYLHFLGGLKVWLIGPLAGGGGLTDAFASLTTLAFLAVVAWINLLAVVIVAAVIGACIVGIVVLTPYLPVLFAARAVPLNVVNGPADKILRLWAVLPLMTVPLALILSGTFTLTLSGLSGAPGLADLLRPFVLLGGLILAGLSPYLVYSGATSTPSLSTGFAAGAAGGGLAVREKMKAAGGGAARRARGAATGARDTVRGARGAAPVSDGGRGHAAGRRVRERVGRLRSGDTAAASSGKAPDDGLGPLLEDKGERGYSAQRLSEMRRDK